MYVQRQIAAWLADGDHQSIAEATSFSWRARDVRSNLELALGVGKVDGDSVRLDAGESFTIPLPNEYDSSALLFVIIRATSIGRVVVASPAHATSTVLINATEGDTLGDYPGFLQFTDYVTSITISHPQGSDPVLFEWLVHEVPDLTAAASFRGGNMAFGYVVDTP